MRKAMIPLLMFSFLAGHAAMAGEIPSREIKLTGDLLIMPLVDRKDTVQKPIPDEAKKHADIASFDVLVDGKLVHRIHGVHPRDPADAKWWGFLDMKEYKGKTAVLTMVARSGMTPEVAAQALSRFESSDTMRHVQPIYKESGRPQFHFSQIQGWNNDPNGMFYSDGLWHISWQCNPLDKGFGGWYWGHAVSRDLIHWQEAPRALRSHGGDETNRYPGMADANCFSGGAAVDTPNTLGLQESDQKTIIAAFTDSPHGESLAYSTDGGFRYHVMHDINNIIVHPIPEGAKGRGSWGRDPKLFWHEPSQKWIIVTYRMARDPGSCSGYMVFYSSPDLKTWTEESITEKLFSNDYKNKKERSNWLQKDWHECPEFVELPVDGDRANMRWVLMDAGPKYQVGTFDGKTFTPDKRAYQWGIFGRMKAAQAFSNGPDGRAVLMIWARMPYGDDAPFASGFTLPLELSLRTADDGVRLYANPVKELEALRLKTLYAVERQPLGGEGSVVSYDANTELVEVVATIKTDATEGALEMAFGEDVHFYHLAEKQLGDNPHVANLRDWAIVHDKEDGKIDVRVYIDRASWEIFMENGSVYKINSRKNLGTPVGKIRFQLHGAQGEMERLKVFQLKSIWPADCVDTLIYSKGEVR